MFLQKIKSKVYRRFVVSYVVILLIPVIILGFVMKNRISAALYKSNIITAETTSESIAAMYEKMLNSMVRTASGLSGNNSFLPYNIKAGYDSVKIINSQLNQLVLLNPEFYDIIYYVRGSDRIITKNQAISLELFPNGVVKYPDAVQRRFDELLNGAEMLSIIPSCEVYVPTNVKREMLTFILPLGNINYNFATMGFIVDADELRSSINANIGPMVENIYLADIDDNIIMSLDTEIEPVSDVLSCGEGVHLSGKNIIVSEKIEAYNLKLVSVFSKSEISNEAARANVIIFVSIFLTCFFGAAVLIFFADKNYSPFLMLKSKFGLEEENADEWQNINNSIDCLNNDNLILQEEMNKFKPYIKKKILSDLISPGKSLSADFIDDDMFEREMYAVAVVVIRRGDKAGIVKYIEERYLNFGADVFFVETTGEHLTFIIAADISSEIEARDEKISERSSGVEFDMYSGSFFRNISDISKSYCMAVNKIPSQKGAAVEYPYENILKLRKHLKANNVEMAEKLSMDIIDMLSDSVPVIFVRCISLDILSVFIEYYINSGVNISKIKDAYAKMIEQFRSIDDVTEIKLEMKNALHMTCNIVSDKIEERNAAADSMISYLKENCCSENFSVNKMAADFGILPSRLSEIFKHSRGRTLTDYIWELRLEKAKMLLKTTDMPISEIANSVGYTILNSFTRKFKESTGVSPKEWRSMFGQM